MTGQIATHPMTGQIATHPMIGQIPTSHSPSSNLMFEILILQPKMASLFQANNI